MGWVRFKSSRELPSPPSSVTLSINPVGQYHLSFVVQQGVAEPRLEGPVIGGDLGLESLLSLVDTRGERSKVKPPKYLRRAEHKLKQLDRSLSRKQKGSSNYKKGRLKRAKQYRKVKNQRLDHARQLAFKLCTENQGVILEGLSVRQLLESQGSVPKHVKRGMRKSYTDAGLAVLVAATKNAGEHYGSEVVLVDPAFTTRDCSQCGYRSEHKTLGVRVWQCPQCRAWLDRDWNAAVNILLRAGAVPNSELLSAGLAGSRTQCPVEDKLACGGASVASAVTQSALLEAGTDLESLMATGNHRASAR